MTLAYSPAALCTSPRPNSTSRLARCWPSSGWKSRRGARLDLLRLHPGAHDGPPAGSGPRRPQSAPGGSGGRRTAGSVPLLLPAGEERRARDPQERRRSGPKSTRCSTALHRSRHRHGLPEFLTKFVGEEKIAGLVKTDLSQLKVVPYYGCLLGRPGELTGEKRHRAAHDDGPAAAGRRRRRQVVELQDRVLRRQRGHAQDGDPAALERQDHRAGAGRRRGSHRGLLPALPRQPGPQAGADQQATSAPTTRCPSSICRRCWAWLSA